MNVRNQRRQQLKKKQLLGVDTDKSCTIYEPCGCKLCNNTGYYGRMGIYEIMKISPAIKKTYI